MSFTKEHRKAAPGWFKGAWYYKPWYVKKRDALPEIASASGMLGSKGLEWPKYPGGYKPTWEDRAGVPGLYKPQGMPVGGMPAIKGSFMAGRNVWRGGFTAIATLGFLWHTYNSLWFKHAVRFNVHIQDEHRFRDFASAPYVQACCDMKMYCDQSRLDRYCRDNIDHLPGVNRNFYHQEDIWAPPFYECLPPFMGRKLAYGNLLEKQPFWQMYLGF